MADIDLLHFELLKNAVQAKFLESHTPSEDKISKWKGIDIVYFQEDLLKIAKGNLSEKSFYTYFKTSPVTKLPRIDILNLLSNYVGYPSWYDFKKNHSVATEILEKSNNSHPEVIHKVEEIEELPVSETKKSEVSQPTSSAQSPALNNEKEITSSPNISSKEANNYHPVKKYLWIGTSIVLAIALGIIIFADQIFKKTYQFHFVDADRGQAIQNTVEIKVLKEGESPISYRVDPQNDFIYSTKDDVLRMVVSSIFYHTDTIVRNLEDAPEKEIIELKPNEYNMMLYSYSTTKDFKERQAQLNQLISNHATIYQVFDNQYFNVETMTKQRYIAFLSLPTTSLENLDVIETKIQNGKIILIKFRIKRSENEN